ncbi:MAG: hypothetical protein KKA73_06360 [Chloroflexi bacterium]|nr:hypothetical protein [Chloroflexota bacterium]MBU1747293.1 hypothetical protein [Chloroflexota bacterium]MBU1877524.1 hypothetical protein [Chloroflexota bacterium]
MTARSWRLALLYALPITTLVLWSFFYWFAIADRYIVFLYYHDMGPLYPDTSPFSIVTSSRYWMAGLVVGGAVMVLYATANWLLGRLVKNYCAPAWWQVWVLCAGPLLVGVPAITMTVNQPTLPAWNAVQVTCATLVGLALALLPGRVAEEHPGQLVLLTFDGLGLTLILLSAIALERVERWLARGAIWYVQGMAANLVAGVILLFIVTGVIAWRRWPIPGATAVFATGLCVAYLLMPLAHHVGFTDGYYYISDLDNFFARNVALQIAIWLSAAVLAVGLTWLRVRLAARRASLQ